MGRDGEFIMKDAKVLDFNPRAPYGARQGNGQAKAGKEYISIHAPHMGRDVIGRDSHGDIADFNPRAPYGARQKPLT